MQPNSFFKIKDCKEIVFDITKNQWTNQQDYHIFNFGKLYSFADKNFWGKVNCINLNLDFYVQWGAPHPGIFEDTFKDIILILVSNRRIIFHAIDYSDNAVIINNAVEYLEKNNLKYIFPTKKNLLFEIKPENVTWVKDNFFQGFDVFLEGCIYDDLSLDFFNVTFKPDPTEEELKAFIDRVYLAFNLWIDNNGLFIVSNKIDSKQLQFLLENNKQLISRISHLKDEHQLK